MITVSYNAYCAISKGGDNDIWTVRPRGVVPLLPLCSQIYVGATVNALLGDTFSRENNTHGSRFHDRDPQFASRILGAMTQSCYIGTRDIRSRVIRSPYCILRFYIPKAMTDFFFFNSSPPIAAYIRWWTVSSLVQVTACRLLGAKPLPEPMLAYCQLDSWEQISVKFESEKFVWQNGGHFLQGEMSYCFKILFRCILMGLKDKWSLL